MHQAQGAHIAAPIKMRSGCSLSCSWPAPEWSPLPPLPPPSAAGQAWKHTLGFMPGLWHAGIAKGGSSQATQLAHACPSAATQPFSAAHPLDVLHRERPLAHSLPAEAALCVGQEPYVVF